MQWVQQQNIEGIIDLTPGIRSLQIHFDSTQLDQIDLLRMLQVAEEQLPDVTEMQVPSRTVYLPLDGKIRKPNLQRNVICKPCDLTRRGVRTISNLSVVLMA